MAAGPACGVLPRSSGPTIAFPFLDLAQRQSLRSVAWSGLGGQRCSSNAVFRRTGLVNPVTILLNLRPFALAQRQSLRSVAWSGLGGHRCSSNAVFRRTGLVNPVTIPLNLRPFALGPLCPMPRPTLASDYPVTAALGGREHGVA